MSPEHFAVARVVIEKFVRAFRRGNAWVDIDDLRGQAWEHVLCCYSGWSPRGGYQLSTYIFTKLQWMARDILKARARERRNMAAYCAAVAPKAPAMAEHAGLSVEVQAAGLAQQLADHLNEGERQLFHLMVAPTPEFQRFVAGGQDRPRHKRSRVVSQLHYAKYLGLHRRTVSRAFTKIAVLCKDVLDERS